MTGIDAELRASAKVSVDHEDPSEANLGSDLWRGLSLDDFQAMLDLFAPTDLPSTLLPTAHRFLSAPPAWPESANSEAAQTLEGTRLLHLLELGASREVADTYTHLAPEDPAPALLKAGVLGLLATAQPSLACFEVKANGATLPLDDLRTKDPFWNDLEAGCATFLGTSAPAMETPPSVSFSVLAAMPPLQALVRLADEQIPLSFSEAKRPDLSHLSPFVRARLLARGDVPFHLRLQIWATSTLDLPPPRPSANDPVLTGSDPWSRFAVLYRQAVAPLVPMTSDVFQKEAASLSRTLPSRAAARALPVLAPALGKMAPASDLSVDDLTRLTGILLAAESPHAGAWISALKTRIGETPTHSFPVSALFLWGQLQNIPEAKGDLPLSFKVLKDKNSAHLGEIFAIFADFLDKPARFIDTPPRIYEKKEGLTKTFHYVMPLSELRNHLTTAAKNKQQGRLVLSGLLALQTPDLQTLDPALLNAVLGGLVKAGLKAEARQIAAYVLLGVILKGET